MRTHPRGQHVGAKAPYDGLLKLSRNYGVVYFYQRLVLICMFYWTIASCVSRSGYAA